MRGAKAADCRRVVPLGIGIVPPEEAAAPQKPLVDPNAKITSFETEQAKKRRHQREHWWREFQEWDGS